MSTAPPPAPTEAARPEPLPPAEKRPTLGHRAQYIALRAAVAILTLVPRSTARAIGGWIGTLGYSPFRIRRRLVEHQLAMALPELTDAERKRIAKGAYANLGRIGIDTAMLSNLPREVLLSQFHEPVGWEHMQRLVDANKGVILVAGHLGNWEMGLSYLAARGVKVLGVARELGNPLIGAYLSRVRRRLGWDVMVDRDAMKQLPRKLAEGYVVPMLSDQGTKGIASTFVPFFGKPARTPRGPAVLSRRLGADCVFAAMPLEADGKYRVYLEPVATMDTGNREADAQAMVEAYTLQLERWVRKYPDQYLWQHRRWRRRPDGTMEDV